MMRLISREQLILGKPVLMDDATCLVHQLKIKEIFDIGSENFFKSLALLTMSEQKIQSLTKVAEANTFDFLCEMSKTKDDFKNDVCEAISLFTKEEVYFFGLPFFQIGEPMENGDTRVIDKNNFNELRSILQQQNFLDENSGKQTKAASKISQKMEENRRKINKIKGAVDLEFVDLVASLPLTGCNLNITQVLELTYYSFNDQFKRSRKKDQYETNIRSLLAGASSKKIKLKDWVSNVQSKEL